MTENTISRNIPRRGILWFGLIAAVLLGALLGLNIAHRGWSGSGAFGATVLVLLAAGLALTLLDATRYWWAMRVVTFVIFAGSFWNLFDAALLDPGRSAADGSGLALGVFLVFGLPCLLHTLWGSVLGKWGPGRK